MRSVDKAGSPSSHRCNPLHLPENRIELSHDVRAIMRSTAFWRPPLPVPLRRKPLWLYADNSAIVGMLPHNCIAGSSSPGRLKRVARALGSARRQCRGPTGQGSLWSSCPLRRAEEEAGYLAQGTTVTITCSPPGHRRHCRTGGAAGRPWIPRRPSHGSSGSPRSRPPPPPVAPGRICRIIATHGWEGARC